MGTKQEILAMLELSQRPCSGQAMAKELGVSRTAVWKAVRALRADGYEITSTQNSGYILDGEPDLLSASRIAGGLVDTRLPFSLTLLGETSSTNTHLREMARSGAPEGSVVVAESQTAGRGRFQRSFLSPSGGIYMSLLLRPNLPPQDCTNITVAAAVCTARAISKVCGIEVDFKWVNDLMIGDKKVCGILTEAMVQMETGLVDYVIVGIGLNVQRVEVGADTPLAKTITSLSEHTATAPLRNRLISAILREFDHYYSDTKQNFIELMGQYRERFWLSGKWVTVSADPEPMPYLVHGVDDNANLLLCSDRNERRTLQSGEVSVKPIA